MPSLSQGFDDFNGRYHEPTGYAQVPSHRTPEYIVGPNGLSQYPDLPTPYSAQPLHGQNYDAYQSNSGLPSIREMPDRRESHGGSQGSNGNMRYYQNDHLGSFPGLPPDSEHGSYPPRRPSGYDPNSRSHTSYPALGPGHVTPAGDYSRYGQPTYEASNRVYSSSYGEVEYSPQPVNGPQQANFGVLGDANDPRSKRRRGNLPKQVTDILRAWFHDHLDHPYPTEEDKQAFIARTGLSISQVLIPHTTWSMTNV
jgi:Homeobox KN domain